jgi:outer membrane protein assembly factor BamB
MQQNQRVMALNDGLRAHDAESGKLLWRSNQSTDLRNVGFTGNPVIRGETIFVAACEAEKSDLALYCLELRTGRRLWTIPLGTLQPTGSADNWVGMQTLPTPALLLQENKLFVLSNNGALLSVDVAEQEIEWIYKYNASRESQDVINRGYRTQSPLSGPATLVFRDGVLYFKESSHPTLFALDVVSRKIVWSRPVTSTASIVGVDDASVYLRSEDLMAIDRNTRTLKWSIRLPSSISPNVILADDRILAATSRGIYELSLETGDRQRIFRGDSLSLLNASIGTVGDKCICVSSVAVSAFPFVTDKAPDPEKKNVE